MAALALQILPIPISEAGQFTRIYAGPALSGVVYLWNTSAPARATYRVYSTGAPFYSQSSQGFARGKTMLTVGPNSFIEVWINPEVSGRFTIT
jgi:hypothetical protein